ncbi:hypothetical protein ACMD2_20224, partial [Ananas comosus]
MQCDVIKIGNLERNKENPGHAANSAKINNENNDVAAIAKSLKKKAKDFQKNQEHENIRAEL